MYVTRNDLSDVSIKLITLDLFTSHTAAFVAVHVLRCIYITCRRLHLINFINLVFSRTYAKLKFYILIRLLYIFSIPIPLPIIAV